MILEKGQVGPSSCNPRQATDKRKPEGSPRHKTICVDQSQETGVFNQWAHPGNVEPEGIEGPWLEAWDGVRGT